jgi:exonuclease SbcC
MTVGFDNLSISKFRSIRGRITIPLSAPIVLVHGPNGAGKTSVLSALELALTGNIVAMRSVDERFTEHLVHQGKSEAEILLMSAQEGQGSSNGAMRVRDGRISGTPHLPTDKAQFFSERCYLAQPTLGRLLEIYQKADATRQSPLTRFVKELLRLDELDALVEGLHTAGDVRRTRNTSSTYRYADERRKSLVQAANSAEATASSQEALSAQQRADFVAAFRQLPAEIVANVSPNDDFRAIEEALTRGDEETQQINVRQNLREILSLQNELASLGTAESKRNQDAAEADERAALEAVNDWRNNTGAKFESLLAKFEAVIPRLTIVGGYQSHGRFCGGKDSCVGRARQIGSFASGP